MFSVDEVVDDAYDFDEIELVFVTDEEVFS